MTELNTYIKYVNIFYNKYNRFPSKFYAKLDILCNIIDQAHKEFNVVELEAMGFNNIEFITDNSKIDIGELQ